MFETGTLIIGFSMSAVRVQSVNTSKVLRIVFGLE